LLKDEEQTDMKLTASTIALALMALASPAYWAKFGELGPAPPPPVGRRHPKSTTGGDVQWQIGILRGIAGRHADQALRALKAGTDDQDHYCGFGARRRSLCLRVSSLR
jgi:hypothetical protein